MVSLTDIKVSLKIPGIGGIEGTWKPNDAERDAASGDVCRINNSCICS